MRTNAFAAVGTAAGIGTGFGFTFGALLVKKTLYVVQFMLSSRPRVLTFCRDTWHSPLYLLGATSFCAAAGGVVSISPDSTDAYPQDRRIDWLGSILVTGGMVLIVFVLGQGESAPQGWNTPCALTLAVIEVGMCGLISLDVRHSRPSHSWNFLPRFLFPLAKYP